MTPAASVASKLTANDAHAFMRRGWRFEAMRI
jgi:hypothetical protein